MWFGREKVARARLLSLSPSVACVYMCLERVGSREDRFPLAFIDDGEVCSSYAVYSRILAIMYTRCQSVAFVPSRTLISNRDAISRECLHPGSHLYSPAILSIPPLRLGLISFRHRRRSLDQLRTAQGLRSAQYGSGAGGAGEGIRVGAQRSSRGYGVLDRAGAGKQVEDGTLEASGGSNGPAEHSPVQAPGGEKWG